MPPNGLMASGISSLASAGASRRPLRPEADRRAPDHPLGRCRINRTDDRPSPRSRAAAACPAGARPRVRVALATGVTCCLGLVAVAGRARQRRRHPYGRAARRGGGRPRRRSPTSAPPGRWTATPPPPGSLPSPTAKPTPTPTAVRKAPQEAGQAAAGPARSPASTRRQMDNAKIIVDVGLEHEDAPPRPGRGAWPPPCRRATSTTWPATCCPESADYPHQGSGSDHDSVGLFQQRPSSGWGTVAELMRPSYAARAFYAALRRDPRLAGHERHRRRPGRADLRLPRRVRPARGAGHHGRGGAHRLSRGQPRPPDAARAGGPGGGSGRASGPPAPTRLAGTPAAAVGRVGGHRSDGQPGEDLVHPGLAPPAGVAAPPRSPGGPAPPRRTPAPAPGGPPRGPRRARRGPGPGSRPPPAAPRHRRAGRGRRRPGPVVRAAR